MVRFEDLFLEGASFRILDPTEDPQFGDSGEVPENLKPSKTIRPERARERSQNPLRRCSVELAGLGWPGKSRNNVKITWGNYVIT